MNFYQMCCSFGETILHFLLLFYKMHICHPERLDIYDDLLRVTQVNVHVESSQLQIAFFSLQILLQFYFST